MDKPTLRRRWRDDPGEADKIRQLPDADFLGARYRYEGVAWAVGAALDGGWSYEDVPRRLRPGRAARAPPPGRRDRRLPARGSPPLGDGPQGPGPPGAGRRRRVLPARRPPRRGGRPRRAGPLVRGRGRPDRARPGRASGPATRSGSGWPAPSGTIVVHQLKVPERLAALAGTAWTLERSEQLRRPRPHRLGHPTGRAPVRGQPRRRPRPALRRGVPPHRRVGLPAAGPGPPTGRRRRARRGPARLDVRVASNPRGAIPAAPRARRASRRATRCRCERTAGISRAGPTTPARSPATACSASRPSSRGAAPSTATATRRRSSAAGS